MAFEVTSFGVVITPGPVVCPSDRKGVDAIEVLESGDGLVTYELADGEALIKVTVVLLKIVVSPADNVVVNTRTVLTIEIGPEALVSGGMSAAVLEVLPEPESSNDTMSLVGDSGGVETPLIYVGLSIGVGGVLPVV